MATQFGENNEKDPIQREISNSLWGNKNNPLHPEYQGDYEKLLNEYIELKNSRPTSWDELLSLEKKILIINMNIETSEKCPFLKKAQGAKSFYYCQSKADATTKRSKNKITFSRNIPKMGSAEQIAHCDTDILKARCVGPDYKFCNFYKNLD